MLFQQSVSALAGNAELGRSSRDVARRCPQRTQELFQADGRWRLRRACLGRDGFRAGANFTRQVLRFQNSFGTLEHDEPPRELQQLTNVEWPIVQHEAFDQLRLELRRWASSKLPEEMQEERHDVFASLAQGRQIQGN